jgi:uncharacterized protein YecE (DUF72 family)
MEDAGFDVLRDAGKLGAVLLQFPFSFRQTPDDVKYLLALLRRFADYPLVVEMRHSSSGQHNREFDHRHYRVSFPEDVCNS